jgi:hypothetical protein
MCNFLDKRILTRRRRLLLIGCSGKRTTLFAVLSVHYGKGKVLVIVTTQNGQLEARRAASLYRISTC